MTVSVIIFLSQQKWKSFIVIGSSGSVLLLNCHQLTLLFSNTGNDSKPTICVRAEQSLYLRTPLYTPSIQLDSSFMMTSDISEKMAEKSVLGFGLHWIRFNIYEYGHNCYGYHLFTVYKLGVYTKLIGICSL